MPVLSDCQFPGTGGRNWRLYVENSDKKLGLFAQAGRPVWSPGVPGSAGGCCHKRQRCVAAGRGPQPAAKICCYRPVVGAGLAARGVTMVDTTKMAADLVAWLQAEVQRAGAQGAVVGLSGGIDSAVVAALCRQAFPDNCLGVIMPCHSDPGDAEDARLVARHLDLPVVEVVLDDVYDQLVLLLTGKPYAAERRSLALANLKPRLRMLTLYFYANERNYLVIGTGNRSELAVGYFTKYGDGGVDLLPLANLVKTQVRELARHLRLPERIIAKAPSAGLWAGQTDEGEMGLSYAVLDHYLLTGEAPPAAKEKIEAMAACSAHKRRLPLVPPF